MNKHGNLTQSQRCAHRSGAHAGCNQQRMVEYDMSYVSITCKFIKSYMSIGM